jgi:alpha-glucosidase
MEAYQDGVNADRSASDYKKTTMQVNRTTKVKLPLASGGGLRGFRSASRSAVGGC